MHCAIYNYDSFMMSHQEDVKERIEDCERRSIEEKLNRAKENPETRFVYQLPKDEEELTKGYLQDLKTLSELVDNIVFMVQEAPGTREWDIPHFYSIEYAADTLEKIRRIGLTPNATDVYIFGEVCFKMREVKTLAERFNLKIRMIPNLLQGGYGDDHPDNITAFWVRPEDLCLYSDFVDVIEFNFDEVGKQKVMYDIYFTHGKWEGPISLLVPGLAGVENRHFTRDFTEQRLNCKRICTLDLCHSCQRMMNIGQMLEGNNLITEFDHQEGVATVKDEDLSL